MMLDKKANLSSFLIRLQMGHKAAETTCNFNNTFGPGSANKCTVQWWFKKFCKGDESLEDEEHGGWPLEGDSDQLRGSLKLILLELCEQSLKSSKLMNGHSAFEANWKGEKAQ